MRKTTASKLLKAITDNLVSVTSTVVNYDETGKEPISVEKFKEDLEFYTNSGIFADTIDFTYEKIAEDKLLISIGKASYYSLGMVWIWKLPQKSYMKILAKDCQHKERQYIRGHLV